MRKISPTKAHLTLVNNLADHFKKKISVDVDHDDLAQSGMVGLLEALNTYNPTHNTNLESFIYSRICSAIRKEIHKGDWMPRRYCRTLRRSFEARVKIENRLGKKANDAEVAEEMRIPIDEYNKFVSHYQISRLLEFDESKYIHDDYEGSDVVKLIHSVSGFGINPIDKCNVDNLKKTLSNAIDKLPQQEKIVLSLYYDEELNMKTIGKILDLSESRVCQVHKSALIHLRKLFIH